MTHGQELAMPSTIVAHANEFHLGQSHVHNDVLWYYTIHNHCRVDLRSYPLHNHCRVDLRSYPLHNHCRVDLLSYPLHNHCRVDLRSYPLHNHCRVDLRSYPLHNHCRVDLRSYPLHNHCRVDLRSYPLHNHCRVDLRSYPLHNHCRVDIRSYPLHNHCRVDLRSYPLHNHSHCGEDLNTASTAALRAAVRLHTVSLTSSPLEFLFASASFLRAVCAATTLLLSSYFRSALRNRWNTWVGIGSNIPGVKIRGSNGSKC